ncbi:MAG TPA: hypothetical protein PLJ76_00250 [Treponemataceae bacterium]|nr:hypothetical protein [Treponemataceae bacterium]
MKRGLRWYRMLLTAGAVMTMLPIHAPADTVRSRASDYFDRIKWTRNYESVQPSALPGYALPGGNEAYASLVLSSTSTSGGIYPSVEGLGTLQYDGIDSGLLALLNDLSESLAEKEVAATLVSNSRRFLPTIVAYRLERVPEPDRIFYSRPEGETPGLRNSTIAVHVTTGQGERKILYLYVETVFENGLWKISDIIFDSESYAAITLKN